MKLWRVLIMSTLVASGCAPQSVDDAAAVDDGTKLPAAEALAMPPSRYRDDHNAMAAVVTLSAERVREVCGSEHALACAGREDRFDVLYLPNPCSYPQDSYAALLCHELAHLQGWSHDSTGDAERCKGVMALDDSCRDYVLGGASEQ